MAGPCGKKPIPRVLAARTRNPAAMGNRYPVRFRNMLTSADVPIIPRARAVSRLPLARLDIP